MLALMEFNYTDKSKLLLSGLRSLWGNLTPNVRKVSVNQEDNIISIHFYYNNKPTEIETELSEEAASELIADFPEPFLISCERHIIKAPHKIDVKGLLVYSRFEGSSA